MCSTIRTIKSKTRRDTQIKSCIAMVVPILTFGSEIWTETKTQETKTGNAKMRFLRNVSSYIMKHQTRKN
jgi:hypothetical protein